MIAANELRIGNCVLVDGKHILITDIVTDGSINQEIESGYYGSWEVSYDGYFENWWGNKSGLIEPIPLIPEILIKCGFEEDNSWYCFVLPNQLELSKNFEFDGFSLNNSYFNTKLTNLHQLQNLYFALCGVELEIKSLIP